MDARSFWTRSAIVVAGLAAAAFLAVPLVNASASRPTSTSVSAQEVVLEQPEADLGAAATMPAEPESPELQPAATADEAPERTEVQAAVVQANGVDAGYSMVSLPRTFDTAEVVGMSPADAAPTGVGAGEAAAPVGAAQLEEEEDDDDVILIGLLALGGGAAAGVILFHDDLLDVDDDDDDIISPSTPGPRPE
jgi:hypothetical protein